MKSFPRRNLPSHAALRSFEAAARHQSFTLAAEELHLTQSAISRQVKELEHAVGIELFRRVGRRVVLTMAGRNLASDLSVDLENIRRTMMRAISAGQVGSALRVACLPTFASRWLVPRLPAFSEAHPETEVSLSTRLKQFDLSSEHFDMAIHFGQADWPDTDMQPFCSETMLAVASPKFQERHAIEGVKDILSVPLIHLTTRPTAWMDYFDAAGLGEVGLLRGKYFDQFNMIVAGAVASLGAALLPTYLIEAELANGSLVTLDEMSISTENSYFLVTPAGQKNTHVEIFCEWMKECVGSTTT